MTRWLQKLTTAVGNLLPPSYSLPTKKLHFCPSFHCHEKKKDLNHSMKKAKNSDCSRKQIYKPPLQFSGMYSTSFSELFVKAFHALNLISRVLYEDNRRPAIDENTWSSLCRESAYFLLTTPNALITTGTK